MIRRSMVVALPFILLVEAALASPTGDLLRSLGKCAETHPKSARLKCYDALSPQLHAVLAGQDTASPAPLATIGLAAPAAAPASPPTAVEAAEPASPAVSAASAPAPGSAGTGEMAAATSAPTGAQEVSRFGLHLFRGQGQPQTTPGEFGQDTIAKATPDAAAPSAPKEINKISAAVTDYATTALGSLVVFLDNGQVWRQTESDTARPALKPNGNKVMISRGAFNSYSMVINGKGALLKVMRVK